MISYEKQYVIFITRICQVNNKANQVKTLKTENYQRKRIANWMKYLFSQEFWSKSIQAFSGQVLNLFMLAVRNIFQYWPSSNINFAIVSLYNFVI